MAQQTTVKLASSMPMSGRPLGETQTIVNAIRQAIDQRNGLVCEGQIGVELEAYDDALPGTDGAWDPEQVRRNAEAIIADPQVVAMLGHYNSGATATSLPIFNQANLLVVSPANTYPGLTKPGTGEPDEPEKFYPTGIRNYARVVPADDLQGAVAARWAQSLGAQRVHILDDGDTYGIGLADVFEANAQGLNMEILGRSTIANQETPVDLVALAEQIDASTPDLVYYGGLAENGAGQFLRDLRSVGATDVLFMGADGMSVQLLIDTALSDAEGAYSTVGGLPFSQLQGEGQAWYDDYRERYKSEPQPYAIYGFEAANVVLDAIDQVCSTDREAIRQTVLNTQNYTGVLGQWSFDANGDTTNTGFSGYQVQNGVWEFVTGLE